jgi:ribosomal protein S18 acetylase RimI-like enzyme
MRIRRGKSGDFKELFRIMNNVPELRHISKGENYNKSWVEDMIKNKARYDCFVAEDKGKIVGFLTAELWKYDKYSFILDVYVKPEHRKNGVASALMKEHEKICKKAGIKTLLVSVLTNNAKMQKFLAKRKFEKGTKVYYYEKDLK